MLIQGNAHQEVPSLSAFPLKRLSKGKQRSFSWLLLDALALGLPVSRLSRKKYKL
jgi:hypothetical protein